LLSCGVAAAYVQGAIVKPGAAKELQELLRDKSIHEGQHLPFDKVHRLLDDEQRREFLTSASSSEGGRWPTGT
jgi:hypothetical protein